MAKKTTVSKVRKVKTMPSLVHKANFAKLLQRKQIGPNGHSKDLLKLSQSNEMMNTLENKGTAEYFKKLKEKFASEGFYREFFE